MSSNGQLKGIMIETSPSFKQTQRTINQLQQPSHRRYMTQSGRKHKPSARGHSSREIEPPSTKSVCFDLPESKVLPEAKPFFTIEKPIAELPRERKKPLTAKATPSTFTKLVQMIKQNAEINTENLQ